MAMHASPNIPGFHIALISWGQIQETEARARKALPSSDFSSPVKQSLGHLENILAGQSQPVVTAHQRGGATWVAYPSQDSAQLPQLRCTQNTIDVPPQP